MKKVVFILVLSVSLLLNIFTAYVFIAKNPMKIQGNMSWVDLYSEDSDATVKFLNDNFGIKVTETTDEDDMDYRVIMADKGLFPYAGIMQITEKYKEKGLRPHATIYITVKDYDDMHKQITENGAKPVVADMSVENMKFGVYIIPGGLDIGIIQYLK